MRQAYSPFAPRCRIEKRHSRWSHLACLLTALALTSACGDDSGGPDNEAGAGGAAAGAAGSSNGGTSSGGTSNGGTSSGGTSNGGTSSGGAGAGGGGAGGTAGAGSQGVSAILTLTPGGSVSSSANFTLIGTVGETPGGNNYMTSANNRLDLGFIGATQ